ncbi:unnamed protein product [Amoebophrya sp. A25]|nr:unnamed protein product [Amoebophrya sp. A25]|eukprot:GSA25T00020145001.1
MLFVKKSAFSFLLVVERARAARSDILTRQSLSGSPSAASGSGSPEIRAGRRPQPVEDDERTASPGSQDAASPVCTSVESSDAELSSAENDEPGNDHEQNGHNPVVQHHEQTGPTSPEQSALPREHNMPSQHMPSQHMVSQHMLPQHVVSMGGVDFGVGNLSKRVALGDHNLNSERALADDASGDASTTATSSGHHGAEYSSHLSSGRSELDFVPNSSSHVVGRDSGFFLNTEALKSPGEDGTELAGSDASNDSILGANSYARRRRTRSAPRARSARRRLSTSFTSARDLDTPPAREHFSSTTANTKVKGATMDDAPDGPLWDSGFNDNSWLNHLRRAHRMSSTVDQSSKAPSSSTAPSSLLSFPTSTTEPSRSNAMNMITVRIPSASPTRSSNTVMSIPRRASTSPVRDNSLGLSTDETRTASSSVREDKNSRDATTLPHDFASRTTSPVRGRSVDLSTTTREDAPEAGELKRSSEGRSTRADVPSLRDNVSLRGTTPLQTSRPSRVTTTITAVQPRIIQNFYRADVRMAGPPWMDSLFLNVEHDKIVDPRRPLTQEQLCDRSASTLGDHAQKLHFHRALLREMAGVPQRFAGFHSAPTAAAGSVIPPTGPALRQQQIRKDRLAPTLRQRRGALREGARK